MPEGGPISGPQRRSCGECAGMKLSARTTALLSTDCRNVIVRCGGSLPNLKRLCRARMHSVTREAKPKPTVKVRHTHACTRWPAKAAPIALISVATCMPRRLSVALSSSHTHPLAIRPTHLSHMCVAFVACGAYQGWPSHSCPRATTTASMISVRCTSKKPAKPTLPSRCCRIGQSASALQTPHRGARLPPWSPIRRPQTWQSQSLQACHSFSA